MRKLITVAIAAAATLALATGAIADPNDSEATLTVTATPSKAGTKDKPKNVKLRFQTQVDKPGTTVGTIDVILPKGLKFSGKGFTKCNDEDLAAQGIVGCPPGSKAGPKGIANAALVTGPVVTPLNFDVYPFVQNAKTLMFYLSLQGGDLQSIVYGKITNKGRKLQITIPLVLRQPGGVDATLIGLDQVFSGKSRKNYIVSSTKCVNKKWQVGSRFGFSERKDLTPVPGPEAREVKISCKKA